MYEELIASLPDHDQYLKRIAYGGPVAHTRDVLSALVFAHQKSVPFENYDICELQLPITLGIEHLFDKVVIRRRGGYCFELNAIFASLLTSLGFEVWPVLARIYRGTEGEQPMPPSHRVNLVCMDGQKYLTDVGFGGPMPAGALLLEEDTIQETRGVRYRFAKRPHHRWTLFRINDEEEVIPMIGFTEAPSEAVDFITPNYYTSTQPESMFVRTRLANIRFDDGFASIGNGQFHLVRADSDNTIPIESKEQEFSLLREYFGISL